MHQRMLFIVQGAKVNIGRDESFHRVLIPVNYRQVDRGVALLILEIHLVRVHCGQDHIHTLDTARLRAKMKRDLPTPAPLLNALFLRT